MFIFAFFVNAWASCKQISNQYRCFKDVKNIFLHFFHSIFCEQPVLFAFLMSSIKDYQIEFIDPKIQQLKFDKIIFYDRLKTRKNMLIIQVHKVKDKFLLFPLIFKLIRLSMFLFLHLKGFELSFSNPFLIHDKSSSNQK